MNVTSRLPVVLLAVGSLLFAACTSTNKAFDSWLGSKGTEFIAKSGLGPPDGVRSDGQGGKILVWGTPPSPVTQIYVNPSGLIYYWRTYDGY